MKKLTEFREILNYKNPLDILKIMELKNHLLLYILLLYTKIQYNLFNILSFFSFYLLIYFNNEKDGAFTAVPFEKGYQLISYLE